MRGSNAPFYREIERHIATLGIDRPRRRVPPGDRAVGARLPLLFFGE
jgi:hypothetical protein